MNILTRHCAGVKAERLRRMRGAQNQGGGARLRRGVIARMCTHEQPL